MSNRIARPLAITVGFCALVAGAMDGRADTTKTAQTKPACTIDDATKVRSVIQFIHAANQAEIKLGKIALAKTQNPDVKAFADHMVKDHTDADKKIGDLATKQGIDLNAQMIDPLYRATITMHDALAGELGGKNGAAFDVGYVAGEPGDHLLVLKAIEEGQKVATGDEKTALNEAHAMVAEHKAHADRLVGKLQFTKGGVGGGPTNTK